MSETVAKSTWVRLRTNGERVTIAVEIGQPYELPTGGWRTLVAMHGLDHPLDRVGGVDSFQSLSLAVDRVRQRLESVIAQGDLLSLPDGEDLDDEESGLLSIAQSLALLAAYFPQR